jgi:hypothetical protein
MFAYLLDIIDLLLGSLDVVAQLSALVSKCVPGCRIAL